MIMSRTEKNIEDLIREIKKLRQTTIQQKISQRLREFSTFSDASDDELFQELCFCLLTANFNAERAIKIQKEINRGFLTFDEIKLATALKRLGYRFPNTRARYIVLARKFYPHLRQIVFFSSDSFELREWLVKNIKGFGYKEASHFMRNIGFTDVAIIDFHIIDLLVRYNVIKKPKRLSKTIYFEIEMKLREIGKRCEMNLAELDLYLWYLETQKLLK